MQTSARARAQSKHLSCINAVHKSLYFKLHTAYIYTKHVTSTDDRQFISCRLKEIFLSSYLLNKPAISLLFKEYLQYLGN